MLYDRHMLKQSAEESGCAPEQLQCNLESLNSMVRPDLAVLHTDVTRTMQGSAAI